MSNSLFPSQGPVMFAQVREDAGVEVELVRTLRNPRNAFCIASGGCTAFALLGEYGLQVDALDISRSQVALVELKAKLFTTQGFDSARRACCEDAREIYDKVRNELGPETRDVLDRQRESFAHGLNNCGTVDQKLKFLASLFFIAVHSRQETQQFLSLDDPSAQHDFFTQRWDNWQWKTATSAAFSRPFLSISRFGNAMDWVPDNFATIMRTRFQRALTTFPNKTNPYLWQTFFNKYSGEEEGYPLYLREARAPVMLKNLKGGLRLLSGDLYSMFTDEDLKKQYDFIALSNVLEFLSADYATRLAWALVDRTPKGAIIVARSIFPRKTRHFPDHIDGLQFDPEASADAESRDRSLFCNFIEIYRRV